LGGALKKDSLALIRGDNCSRKILVPLLEPLSAFDLLMENRDDPLTERKPV